jgi:hypothetical protein
MQLQIAAALWSDISCLKNILRQSTHSAIIVSLAPAAPQGDDWSTLLL